MDTSTAKFSSGDALIGALRSRPGLKASMKRVLDVVGYDTTDWVRVVMYQRCFAFIRKLGPERLHALEISGGNQWRRQFDFASFSVTSYPGFDICAESMERKFDLIIADQVFEHLKWPMRAARNVYAMLEPGGYFIISTPFMVRYHASPIDCNRWTEQGMSCLLQEAGFPDDHIVTDSWGNRACVKANMNSWKKRGFFGSLKNEPNYPVMVWAYARKPLSGQEAKT